VVNIWLIIFNLLPAFPMDGGRVLRALLAMRMDYVRATQLAASIGQAMALLFAFVGLFFNPFLVFIALFVWMGAAAEASLVQMRTALAGIPVAQAMISEFRAVASTDRIGDVAGHVLAGFQQDFPVVDQGQLRGVLTRADLIKALAEKGVDEPVEGVMRHEFETTQPTEMLEQAFARLQERGCYSMPVVKGANVVGMLTAENVGEFLMIQSALRGAQIPAQAAAN
jgi:predicted transcriptional regulator